MKECVTHFAACDCREEKFKQLQAKVAVLEKHIIKVHETSIAWGKQGMDMFAGTKLREEYKAIKAATMQKRGGVVRKDFHMIEPNKDIVLHCSDWTGDYKVEGRMIPYKKPVGGRAQKFCCFDEVLNDWFASQDWQQREGWEYKPAATLQGDEK